MLGGCVLFLVLVIIGIISGIEVDGKLKFLFFVNFFIFGDLKWCVFKMGGNVVCFEVFFGFGWDNFQNKDVGMLVQYNYLECWMMDDGWYLIFDGVFMVFFKFSKLEVFGELFQYWNNFILIIFFFVNVEVGLYIGFFGISGKYFYELESVCKY